MGENISENGKPTLNELALQYKGVFCRTPIFQSCIFNNSDSENHFIKKLVVQKKRDHF